MHDGNAATNRAAWVQAYERTGDATAVCRRFGISRVTLRKWWRRYQDAGAVALHDASRVPRSSPARKVFPTEKARIHELRAAGHSLSRLRTLLRAEGGPDVSVATIRNTKFLKA